MFTQQIGRNGRRIGQVAWRTARGNPVRGYAAQGENAPNVTYTFTPNKIGDLHKCLRSIYIGNISSRGVDGVGGSGI